MRVGALLCLAIIPASSRAQSSRPEAPVLFSATIDRGGQTRLAPILVTTPSGREAIFRDDTISTLPYFFRTGLRYPIRINGVDLGIVPVTGARREGCSNGWVADATTPRGGASGREIFGLAGNVPGLRAPIGASRAPTEGELSELRRRATMALRSAGVKAERKGRLLPIAQAAYETAAGDTLLAATWMYQWEGNVTVPAPRRRPGTPGYGDTSAVTYPLTTRVTVLVITDGARGRWRAGMSWAKKVGEEDREVRMVLGFVDLKGDGAPVLITRNLYDEGQDFSVYARGERTWRQRWSGGGGGC